MRKFLMWLSKFRRQPQVAHEWSVRLPTALVEVVDGGWLIGPAVFCESLPEGFTEVEWPSVMYGDRRFVRCRVSKAWLSHLASEHSGTHDLGVRRYTGSEAIAPLGWWKEP